jgi:hypothetical protein
MPKHGLVERQEQESIDRLINELRPVKFEIQRCDFNATVAEIVHNARTILAITDVGLGDPEDELGDVRANAMKLIHRCDKFQTAPSLEKFKKIIRAYRALRDLTAAVFLEHRPGTCMRIGGSL